MRQLGYPIFGYPIFVTYVLAKCRYDDNLAVELDALSPQVLEQVVQEAIEANLDLSLFEEEKAREDTERERIEELRNYAQKSVQDYQE